MWPWEHAAVAYLLFSPAVRVARGRPPDGATALVLAVGALLPDLVDKPLSWGLGLFPSGYAVAHSALVAVPVGLAVLALATRRDRSEWGFAFLFGYWSHLVGDVVNPLRDGGGVDVTRVLWPLVEQEPYGEDLGLGRGAVYLGEFLAGFPPADPAGVVLLFAFPVLALVLWIADGAPGVGLLRDLASRRLP